MTIATVTAITGQAWARDADGNLRELSIGDTLQEGEVLVTADGARVELDFGDNLDPTVIQGGQEVAMTPQLSGEEAVAEEEASALDEDLEALLTAIDEGEGDLLAELDPTAAGAGPGGGAEGGHSFVMLARITEPLTPLSYEYGLGQFDQVEFPEDTFLDQAEEDSIPTVTTLDLNGDGDTVWESALEQGSGGGVATTSGAFQIDTGSDELALIEVQDAAGNWVAISASGADVQGTYGVLSVNPDGSWTYTLTEPLDHPLAGETGASDQVPGDAFAVRVTDDDGDVSDPATLAITITDDGPAAVADAVGEIAEDSSVNIDVFANDTAGADGVDLTTGVAVATAPTKGSVVYNNDGTFTYTANPGAEGDDSFTYTITDADGDTSTATVTLSIAEDSTPTVTTPDLNEDGDTVWESALTDGSGQGGAAITTTVTGTFQITTGADTLDQIEVQDASGSWVVIAADGTVVNGDYGTLTVDTDGSWSYTLSDNTLDHDTADAILGADQVQDLFDVRVTDSDGDVSDPATLTIDINDDGALAVSDTGSVQSGGTLTVAAAAGLLANDTLGADGATVTAVDDSTAQGTLTWNSDGSYTYTALPNATYSDVFTYTITDGDGDTATATLTLSVTDGSPTAPTADVIVNEAALDLVQDGADLAAGTVEGSDPTSTAETISGTLAASDPNGDALTYTAGTFTGSYGTLTIDTAGNYTYTLTAPVEGPTADNSTDTIDNAESFSYTVTDANGNSSTGTLTVDIIDDVPTAVADTGSVQSGGTLTVAAAAGLLANDTLGADGATVTAVDDSTAQGTLTWNSDGSYTYTALPNATYSDVFTYTITDGDGDTATATLTLSVTDGSPTAPTADVIVNEAALDLVQDGADLAAGTVEGSDPTSTAETISGTLAASDPNGDALTYTAGTFTGSYGTLTIDTAGNYTYTLTAPVEGPTADNSTDTIDNAESFSYTVTDANGNSSTGTLTVDIIDDVPTAVADTGSVQSGGTLTVAAAAGLLANDTLGADGATVTAVDDSTAQGTLTWNSDGSYTYTALPNATYSDVFTYTITDGDGDTATATLTLSVTDGSPTAPTADVIVNEAALDLVQDGADLAAGTVEGSDPTSTAETISGTLAASDPNGDALTYTAGTFTGSYGTLTIDTAGNYTYTLTAPVEGPTADNSTDTIDNAESFSYTVTDANGNSSTGTLTVDIIDDVPTAVADTGSVQSGGTLTVAAAAGLLANDTLGADGATVTAVDDSTAQGTLTWNSDGSYTYTALPNATYSDVFTYTITDGDGDTATATLTLSVTDGSPTAPTADVIVNEAALDLVQDGADLAAGTVEGSDPTSTAETISGTLAASDPNGDALTYTAGTFTGSYGTLTIDTAGNYTYTLTAPVEGPTADNSTDTIDNAESFSYTVTDANGNSSTGTLTVDIIDDVPTAVADTGSVQSGGTLTVAAAAGLLANDTLGADGATVTAVDDSTAQGTLTWNSDGSYTYTALPNATYSDVFTYTITDGDGDTATATLTLSVTDGSPTAPTADVIVNEAALDLVQDGADLAAGTVEGSDPTSTAETISGTLAASDPNGDALTYTAGTFTGSYGTLTIDTAGNYTYTLTAPVEGPTADNSTDTIDNAESFSYTVTDANGNSSTGTLTVDIIDDVPTAVADTGSVQSGGTLTVAAAAGLLANDTLGADGATVTAVDDSTAQGTLTWNSDGSYTYTALPNATYSDVFTYTITDGDGDTATATLTLSVTDGSPTAPTADVIVNEAALDLVQDGADLAAGTVEGSDPTSTAETISGTLAASDPNGDALTYTAGTFTGSYGTLTIDTAGNYTYTLTAPVEGPTADNSTDTIDNAESFSYTVTDANGNSSTGTLTVDIIDDVPTAVADTGSVQSGGTLTVAAAAGLLANDTLGADGATVTAVDDSTAQGTLTWNSDGSYTYTALPNATYSDVFTYTITDGDGDTATATLTLSVTDGSPTAPTADVIVNEAALDLVQDGADLAAGTVEGSDPTSTAETISGTLAASDPNGDALTYTAGTFTGSYGTLTIDTAGNYTYTLTAPVEGPTADNSTDTIDNAESFSYTVTDANGNSSTGTLTVDIIDDVPTAVADTGSVQSGGTLTVAAAAGLLANDTLGADGATVTAVDDSTAQGTLTWNSDGSYTYTALPNATYSDVFTYTITDGDGDTATATLTLSVTDGSPTAPTADVIVNEAALDLVQDGADLAAGTVEGSDPTSTAETISGTLAASDPNGDALTYTAGTFTGSYGTLTIDTAGNYTYTLTAPVEGPTADNSTDTIDNAESFSYTVTDANGNSSTGTLTVDIIDDVPTAVADTGSVQSGGTLTVAAAAGLLANDTLGADGATVTAVDDSTAQGTLTWNSDGSYTYTALPNATYSDVFTYTITDGDGDTATATLTLSVTDGSPTAPTADVIVNEAALDLVQDGADLAAGTVEGSDPTSTAETISGTLAASDPNGDALTYTAGTFTGSYGTLTIDTAGNYTYTLTAPVEGPTADNSTDTIDNAESFSYTVTDANGNSSTGTLTVDIIDDVPYAVDPDKAYLVNLVGQAVTAIPLDIDGNVDDNYGADQAGSISFAGIAGTGTPSEVTASGSLVYLYSNGLTLIGSMLANSSYSAVADPSNLSSKVFTVELNPDADLGGASDTYSFTLHQQIDGGASSFSVADGGYAPDGGNSSYFFFDDTTGDDRDILLTPTEAGSTVNTSNNDFATGTGMTIGGGEGIRIDFVQGLDGDFKTGPITYDSHYTVQGAGAIIGVKGSTTVRIAAYDDYDDGTSVDPDDISIGNGDLDPITAVVIEYNNQSVTVYAGIESVAVGGQTFTLDWDNSSYEGQVLVGGVVDGTALAAVTDDGFSSLEFHYDAGTAFTVNSFSGVAVTPGEAVDFALDLNLTDGDGDTVLIEDAIDIHLSPDDHEIDMGTAGSDNLEADDGQAMTLVGLEGDDTLIGDIGEDILVGGPGSDSLTGGAGADTFVWNLGDEGEPGTPANDTVTDFSATEGDVLNLSDLLSGMDDGDSLSSYIQAEASASGTLLHISTSGELTSDGTTISGADQTILLEDVSYTSTLLQTLIDDGQLDIE